MSGRANFNAINGNVSPNPLPDPEVGGTTGVRPNAGGTGEAPQVAPQPTVPSADVEASKALIKRLDILLSRAAQSATKSVDAEALKTTLREVNLDKSSRNLINTAAAKAEAAFKEISSFTGRQLGEAVSATEGKFDWNVENPAGKAIKEAIDAQGELSDLLRRVLDQIPGGETAAALEEALLQCDRRTCEIQTLVCEFADLIEKSGTSGNTMKAVLDAKLEKLLPRKALEMHGNDAAIEAMKSQFKPIVERLDTLVKSPGKTLSDEEMAAIGREIDQVSNAIEATAKTGSANGVAVDRSLLAATKDVLADVKGRLADARGEALKACLSNFVEKAFTAGDFPLLSMKYVPFLKVVAPNIAKVVETLDEIQKAAKAMAKEPSDENLQKVKELWSKLASIPRTSVAKEIIDIKKYDTGMYGVTLDASGILLKLARAARALGYKQAALFGGPDSQEFAQLLQRICADSRRKLSDERNYLFNKLFKAYNTATSLQSQVAHLSLVWDTYKRMDESKFRSNGTVFAAFEGKLRVTTLVESRIRGIPDAYVDPDLDDLNVESSKPLGSGSVNTVHEVVCRNKGKYVFKPEASGRKAFGGLGLAKGVADTQMVSQLNMATQKTADLLGLGDIMCKTTVGSHKGAFGIFMEKAPGKEAGYFKECAVSGGVGAFPPGQLSPKQIKELPDEKYAVVIGDIMRKANRLEWFDLITGQGDRHYHNYLLAVGKDDPPVTLKAIDNDACFPAYRKGLRTFVLVGEHAQKLPGEIRKLCNMLYPKDSTAAENAAIALMQDPGIKKHSDNTYTVDTTLAKSPLVGVVLRNTIGVHTTALPEYIDEELYLSLMKLAEPSEAFNAFKAEMETTLTPGAAASAVARLRQAIEYAKKLFDDGKVVPAGEWHRRDKQRQILGGLPPNNAYGEYEKVKKLSADAPDYNTKGEKTVSLTMQHIKNGYFRRDLAIALAKPGWFD